MPKTLNNDLYAQQAWSNNFHALLKSHFNSKQANTLIKAYENATEYLMCASPENALIDVIGIERSRQQQLAIQFASTDCDPDDDSTTVYINLYSYKAPVDLSDSLEIFQSFGLKVYFETPKKLILGEQLIWIHRYRAKSIHDSKHQFDETFTHNFEQLFLACWHKQTLIDPFNQLLFSSHLNTKEIQVFRAYAAYAKQLKFTYSARYIAETLHINNEICSLLIRLFHHKFNPELEYQVSIQEDFTKLIKQVESIDQDSILHALYELIQATNRTNYYQKGENPELVISYKLATKHITFAPKPTPEVDLFMYCRRFEGIHLRGGKVARGGIRWSTRIEDFRTEVLGLMKAQMIKNAVIVPTGSKGGFICKLLANINNRDQQLEEVEACYRIFIQNLLNITDNLIQGSIVTPEQVKRHDEDDPYLVVAADKGTASFSDIANSIAQHHQFWLDDAFASGGSQGYDHKKMGITARGAWESVKRHFRTLNINSQTQEISVIGIGDMSGDVFGNGMLLSEKICLKAAFNHLHIFIDPTPNAALSYQERERLFKLKRSSWNDYTPALISHGGGVFSRKSKTIQLTTEIKSFLKTQLDTVSPNQLINLILKAPADLLWNGGIGTYVKASHETNADAQDRANDRIRVNGNELSVKMIGEGGNLGVTQAGRVEFAEQGGDIYNDSIDNSAGVDCSDHEVNIKILLQEVMREQLITQDERNELLHQMTDEVADLVLRNNIQQGQIIDMIASQAPQLCYDHARFINHLESSKVLSRKLEGLPSDSELKERATLSKGLLKPEIAVLLSYSKLIYKQVILEAPFNDDSFNAILLNYFPKVLQNNYAKFIQAHALKENIIATQLSNQIVNQIGIGFGFKMKEETGANIIHIIKSYLVVCEIFDINSLWQAIEKNNNISEKLRYESLQTIANMVQKSISWILRNYPNQLDVRDIVKRFSEPVKRLDKAIPHIIMGFYRKEYKQFKKRLQSYKLEPELAESLVKIAPLTSAFDISDIAIKLNSPIEKTAKLFYSVEEILDLHWIKEEISKLSKRNHWHQLAITSMRNEIHACQKSITFYLLKTVKNKNHIFVALEHWKTENSYVLQRFNEKLSELKTLRELDFPMLVVAINEVKIIQQQLAK